MSIKIWFARGWRFGLATSLLALVEIVSGVAGNRVSAQIIPDNTLGNESSIITPNVLINNLPSDQIDSGAVRGANLFHSFQQFNVSERRGAYFTTPTGIENILSRVTGGSRSEIFGRLGVLGNANLFLINPNGIIFGPNASLDVKGSFVATTANAIKFGEQGFFSASVPETSNLVAVAPSALFFNAVAAQRIINQSQAQSLQGNIVGLELPTARTLALIGGDVILAGGNLTVPGGRIELGSVAGSGLVSFNQQGPSLVMEYEGIPAFGNIQLTNGASVDTSGLFGSSAIQLTGKQVRLSEKARLVSFNLGSQPGGSITVNASESIEIQGVGTFIQDLQRNASGAATISDLRNGFFTVAYGTGAAGDIVLNTRKFVARDGVFLQTSTAGSARGGNLTVNATDRVELAASTFVTATGPGTIGNAGDLTINTGTLSMQDNALVTTSTLGRGKGGNLTVNASESVQLRGGNLIPLPNNIFSPTGIVTNSFSIGNAGDLKLSTERLVLRDGAALSVGTFAVGNGGTFVLNAKQVELTGRTFNRQIPSQLSAPSGPGSTGRSGSVSVTASNLVIQDGAEVTVTSLGTGAAGSINIVSDSIALDNQGSVEAAALYSEGGDITITSESLSLSNGATLSASTRGLGNAGKLTINIEGTLQANNGSISTAAAGSSGGAIDISAGDIRLIGDSNITTSVLSGVGGGGNINLSADSIIALDDSDILAFSADGNGGNIRLNTPAFFGLSGRPAPSDLATLDDNGQVDVNARGSIASGTITLPDVSFLQNSLTQLPENLIDTNTLIANSCIARSTQQGGSFIITGAGNLPSRPGDAAVSPFPTGTLRPVLQDRVSSKSSSSTLSAETRSWQMGELIVEPQGLYRLANGQLVLSRRCTVSVKN